MKLHLKELADKRVLLTTEKGFLLGVFPNPANAIKVCREWYKLPHSRIVRHIYPQTQTQDCSQAHQQG